jgi:hypothetical protein
MSPGRILTKINDFLTVMVLPRSLANTFQTTLVPTTRSPQSFALAKTWLQEYSLKHPECQGGRLHNQLPTRLVHVRQESGNSKLVANICNGSMLPPDTSYLSLSHCWGKIRFLKTTQSNIPEFQISIPIHKLSRVFQDALLVARTGLYLRDDNCILPLFFSKRTLIHQ